MSDFNPINISIAIYLCWYEMEKSLHLLQENILQENIVSYLKLNLVLWTVKNKVVLSKVIEKTGLKMKVYHDGTPASSLLQKLLEAWF